MTEDREAFLERWSRRKLQQVEERPAPPAVTDQKEESAVVLPPVEELTPESDFTPFMNPKVDGDTRRAALKKLFTDAHYNTPDPFESYSGDYTGGEAIPMDMLKKMQHVQKMLFDEPEKKVAAAAPEEDATKEEEGAKNDAAKQDT